MDQFPRDVRPKAPPIKTQGIKTKLVPFILQSFSWDGTGKWIEPFVGSGAVVFNAAPKQALIADTNKHIVHFYKSVQNGTLTPADARDYLEEEGAKLEKIGADRVCKSLWQRILALRAEGNSMTRWVALGT